MIWSIQAYRGIASLLVVLYHSYLMISTYYPESSSFNFIYMFQFGHAGVEFFFVLSGFIMYHIYKTDKGYSLSVLKDYLKKRILRIYPLYWIILMFFLPFWLFIPTFGFEYHREIDAFIFSLLLLPQENPPHVTVAWTLTHEVLFYFIFAICIYYRNLLKFVLLGWFIIIVYYNIYSVHYNVYLDFIFSKYNLLFLFGILSAYFSKYILGGFIYVVLGASIFIAIAFLDVFFIDKEKLIVFYGIAASIILLNSYSKTINDMFYKQKVMMLLGNASFSIYLTHYFTISFISKIIIFLQLNDYIHNKIIFFIFVISSIIVGVFVYITVEKKILFKEKK